MGRNTLRQTITVSVLGCLALKLLASGVLAQESKSAFPVRYVPKHALFAIGIRPAQLIAAEPLQGMKPLAEHAGLLRPLHGVPIEDVERLMMTFSLIDPTQGRYQSAIVLQTKEPIDSESIIQTVMPHSRLVLYGGQKYRKDTDAQFQALSVWFPDANTYVITQGDGGMEAVIDAVDLKFSPTWRAHVKPDASAFAYENAARAEELIEMGVNMLRSVGPGRGRPFSVSLDLGMILPLVGMIAPLWQDLDTIVWNFTASDALELDAIASVEENGSVEEVEETLHAMRVLKRNAFGFMTEQDQQLDNAESKAFTAILQISDELVRTTEITRDDHTIRITASVPMKKINETLAALAPSLIEARNRQRRLQCKSSLKQLAIAMHNYHDTHKQFPPPVIIGPDGKTPVSWRVAILPFLDANELHKQYHFDEPWDSEHNKKLLDQMPPVFRHPEDEPDSTNTSYFAIVGEKTAWGPKDGDGVRLRDIIDGSSNTIMLVEAKKKVPWTKPDDIAYDPEAKGLPKFGGWYDDGYHACFCDGAVRFISNAVAANEEQIRLRIERNDGRAMQPLP